MIKIFIHGMWYGQNMGGIVEVLPFFDITRFFKNFVPGQQLGHPEPSMYYLYFEEENV